MSDVQARFDGFFEHFRSSQLWRDMVNTREDSPWHREENVSVHTGMLLDWYKNNLFNYRNGRQQMLTMVACLFHDVGKPPAQVVKTSPERGEYRAYHGHEQLSARMWVDYAMTNKDMVKETLRFSNIDISAIAMMIEYHVPFAMKDAKKRKAMKDALLNRLGTGGHRAWLDFLLSDQHGRCADEQAKHLEEVDVWMKAWETV